MPAFDSVVASSTALCRMPVGRTYHGLDLVYTGLTLAQMTEIRILANGNIIHRYSATERDAENQYLGLAAAAGYLHIPFDRVRSRSQYDEEAFKLITGVADKNGNIITTLECQVDINASNTGAITLAAWANQSASPANPDFLPLMKIEKVTWPAFVSGENNITTLKRGTTDTMYLERICIRNTTHVITDIKLDRDNVRVFDRTDGLNRHLAVDGGRVNNADLYNVDCAEKGFSEPIALRGVQDLKLTVTTSNTIAAPVAGITYLGTFTNQ